MLNKKWKEEWKMIKIITKIKQKKGVMANHWKWKNSYKSKSLQDNSIWKESRNWGKL